VTLEIPGLICAMQPDFGPNVIFFDQSVSTSQIQSVAAQGAATIPVNLVSYP